MCTITVEVDHDKLQAVNPEFASTAAIRRWVQQLIDIHTKELVDEEFGMMDLETARENLHKMVREVYSHSLDVNL